MPIARLITTVSLLVVSSLALAQVGANNGVLNPNLADKSELTGLDGIDDAIADAIISARPIASNAALDGVIGDALSSEEKAALRHNLFLPVNLNKASEDELKLVPGINGKMVHEFEEYRPYGSIEQFQREIGKYVDDEEVARYEQFVFVPIDLNSASSEAFASIPGMSGKMVREFEEYRPYSSMEQFRREMGKYVDENEVARLERYVYIASQ
jgi:DNA uptake protein ComE-like DNA-binding protein